MALILRYLYFFHLSHETFTAIDFTYGFSSANSAAKLGWFSFLYCHALWWNIELWIIPLCWNQLLDVGGLCFTDAGPKGDWGVQGGVRIHSLHTGGRLGAETGGGGGHPGRNPGNLIHRFGKEGDLIVHKILMTFGKVVRHLVDIPVKSGQNESGVIISVEYFLSLS